MGNSFVLLLITGVILTVAGLAFKRPMLFPVSYTHLDVYKRQV